MSRYAKPNATTHTYTGMGGIPIFLFNIFQHIHTLPAGSVSWNVRHAGNWYIAWSHSWLCDVLVYGFFVQALSGTWVVFVVVGLEPGFSGVGVRCAGTVGGVIGLSKDSCVCGIGGVLGTSGVGGFRTTPPCNTAELDTVEGPVDMEGL